MHETVTKLLNIFYPPRCIFCDKLMHYSTIHCECNNCNSSLPPLADRYCEICGAVIDSVYGDYTCRECKQTSRSFLSNIGCYQYIDMVRECVLRFKFNNCTDYAQTMGNLMAAQVIRNHAEHDFDIVIPIPSGAKSFNKRGYNQSELLARVIAKQLSLPIDVTSFIRVKEVEAQHTLNAAERRKNMIGAFKVANDKSLRGKVVLLVDDVYTTGSTLNSAAKTLIKQGKVAQVHGIVFALTPKDV